MTGLLFTRDEANKADLRRRWSEVSLWLKVRGKSRKSCALSISLYLTAVRGRSYAEGAQRDSSAIPLRVPASGGVWLNNKLPSPHTVSD